MDSTPLNCLGFKEQNIKQPTNGVYVRAGKLAKGNKNNSNKKPTNLLVPSDPLSRKLCRLPRVLSHLLCYTGINRFLLPTVVVISVHCHYGNRVSLEQISTDGAKK